MTRLTAYPQAIGDRHGPPATPRHPDSIVRRAATAHRRALEPARTADADADHRQPAGHPGGERPRSQRAENRPSPASGGSTERRNHTARHAHHPIPTRGRSVPGGRTALAPHFDQGHEGRRGDRRAPATGREDLPMAMGRHRRWRGTGRRGNRHPWDMAGRFDAGVVAKRGTGAAQHGDCPERGAISRTESTRRED